MLPGLEGGGFHRRRKVAGEAQRDHIFDLLKDPTPPSNQVEAGDDGVVLPVLPTRSGAASAMDPMRKLTRPSYSEASLPAGGGSSAAGGTEARLAMLERMVGKLSSENRDLHERLAAAPAAPGDGPSSLVLDRLRSLERIVARDNQRLDDIEAGKTPLATSSAALDQVKGAVMASSDDMEQKLETEKRKAALLYTEVLRLGKAVDSLTAAGADQGAATESRLSALDAAVNRHSSLLEAQQDRERSKFDAIGVASDTMTRHVAELGDRLQQLAGEVRAESSERRAHTSEQQRFLSELRTKLQHESSDIGDKLGVILTETSSKILSERASMEARMLADREAARLREQQQRAAMEDVVTMFQKRVADVSALLTEERATRREDVEALSSRADSHIKTIVDSLKTETRRRAEDVKTLTETINNAAQATDRTYSDLLATTSKEHESLAEIVRLEIASRVDNESKLRHSLKHYVQSISGTVDSMRKEAAAAVADLRAQVAALKATDSAPPPQSEASAPAAAGATPPPVPEEAVPPQQVADAIPPQLEDRLQKFAAAVNGRFDEYLAARNALADRLESVASSQADASAALTTVVDEHRKAVAEEVSRCWQELQEVKEAQEEAAVAVAPQPTFAPEPVGEDEPGEDEPGEGGGDVPKFDAAEFVSPHELATVSAATAIKFTELEGRLEELSTTLNACTTEVAAVRTHADTLHSISADARSRLEGRMVHLEASPGDPTPRGADDLKDRMQVVEAAVSLEREERLEKLQAVRVALGAQEESSSSLAALVQSITAALQTEVSRVESRVADLEAGGAPPAGGDGVEDGAGPIPARLTQLEEDVHQRVDDTDGRCDELAEQLNDLTKRVVNLGSCITTLQSLADEEWGRTLTLADKIALGTAEEAAELRLEAGDASGPPAPPSPPAPVPRLAGDTVTVQRGPALPSDVFAQLAAAGEGGAGEDDAASDAASAGHP